MLGCLLEYMSNGSLEDHLRKDRFKAKSEKLTWKDRLLLVAHQAAMGVQYLHNSRYFDEKLDAWKDCIIHRDLKPDNMLIAEKDFALKLSDFGEARALDLSLTMTTVGTPVRYSNERHRAVNTTRQQVFYLFLPHCKHPLISSYLSSFVRSSSPPSSSRMIGTTIKRTCSVLASV